MIDMKGRECIYVFLQEPMFVFVCALACKNLSVGLWDSVLGLVVRVHHKEVDIVVIMVAASHNHKIYWWRHTFCIISTP